MREVLKELPDTLKLALPIFLGMVGHMLIQLTDSIMLGHYGTLELAASAFGSSLVLLILYIGIGFGQAISALASAAKGAGDDLKARGIYELSARSAFVFSIFCVVLSIAILPVYDLLGQPPLVAAWAKPYSLLIALSFIPALIFQTLRSYYEVLKRPWVPFLFLFVTVVLNIFFNYILIFGAFGLPALGIIGSGLGTILARLATVVLFVGFAHRPKEALHEKFAGALPLPELPKILKIAGASGAQMVAMTLAYTLGGLWIGTMGVEAIAANRMVGMFDGTVYMLPLGLAIALTVRIGRAKGAGDLARVAAIYRGGKWLAFAFCAAIALWMYFGGASLANVFGAQPQTLQTAVAIFQVAAMLVIFDGSQCVTMGALRGLADVAKPALLFLAVYWLLAMPLAYYLAFILHWGAVGVWWGYVTGLVIVSIALGYRFWHSLKILSQKQ